MTNVPTTHLWYIDTPQWNSDPTCIILRRRCNSPTASSWSSTLPYNCKQIITTMWTLSHHQKAQIHRQTFRKWKTTFTHFDWGAPTNELKTRAAVERCVRSGGFRQPDIKIINMLMVSVCSSTSHNYYAFDGSVWNKTRWTETERIIKYQLPLTFTRINQTEAMHSTLEKKFRKNEKTIMKN